jgi:hypothetical protein
MNKTSKRRAPTPEYVSEKQLVLSGFETPFSQTLDKSNRWVYISNKKGATFQLKSIPLITN